MFERDCMRPEKTSPRPLLLPIALLLPGLVRVEPSIRAALGITDMTLWALVLRLMLLVRRLRSTTTRSREPLGVVEATLRLLDATAALRTLTGLTNTSSTDILDVGVRFVRSLRRTAHTLTERRTRCRT